MDEQTLEQDFKTNFGLYEECFPSIHQLILSFIDCCSKYQEAGSQTD